MLFWQHKEMVNREVEILKLISHTNIVQLIDIYETPNFVYIVMELYAIVLLFY